jgi:hypothetical protein
MNGVHDMGGMHGMGSIQYERNEPVFHEPWEALLFALNRAVRAWGKWTTDASRDAVELIPAPEYLRMSYYEQRLHALIELMVKSGGWSLARKLRAASRRRARPRPLPRLLRVPFRVWSRRVNLRAEKYRWRLASRWASAYAPATSIRLVTRDCRATRAASLAQSIWTMASTSSRTPTPMPWARSRNTCTQCGSPRASCGGSKPSGRDAVYLDMWDDYLECT